MAIGTLAEVGKVTVVVARVLIGLLLSSWLDRHRRRQTAPDSGRACRLRLCSRCGGLPKARRASLTLAAVPAPGQRESGNSCSRWPEPQSCLLRGVRGDRGNDDRAEGEHDEAKEAGDARRMGPAPAGDAEQPQAR